MYTCWMHNNRVAINTEDDVIKTWFPKKDFSCYHLPGTSIKVHRIIGLANTNADQLKSSPTHKIKTHYRNICNCKTQHSIIGKNLRPIFCHPQSVNASCHQRTSINSTSNNNHAFGGMAFPAPLAP